MPRIGPGESMKDLKYATDFALHYTEALYKRPPGKSRKIPQNPAYSPLFNNLFSGLLNTD